MYRFPTYVTSVIYIYPLSLSNHKMTFPKYGAFKIGIAAINPYAPLGFCTLRKKNIFLPECVQQNVDFIPAFSQLKAPYMRKVLL